jgi:hypothetical protein
MPDADNYRQDINGRVSDEPMQDLRQPTRDRKGSTFVSVANLLGNFGR